MSFKTPPIVKKHRQSNHPIHPLLLSRWSPRALSGEPISNDELMPLFEAARWAPSSSNLQPWTFLYAHRESEHWSTYFDFLNEFNQMWTKNAAVLVVVVAQIDSDGHKSDIAEFDTGAAWQNLALEATGRGLVAHGIGGFDKKQTAEKLNIPDTHKVMAMIAIGKPGPLNKLHERMHKQEIPNQRQPLEEMVKEGVFNS
jgi:nitroreductase